MATSKLIPDLWNPYAPHSYLSYLLPFEVLRHNHHIHHSLLCPSGTKRNILRFHIPLDKLLPLGGLHGFSDQYLLIFYGLPRTYQPIRIQFGRQHFGNIRVQAGRLLDDGVGGVEGCAGLLGFICSIKHTSKEAPVDGRLIDDDTILLIVASEACHGHHRVTTDRHGFD